MISEKLFYYFSGLRCDGPLWDLSCRLPLAKDFFEVGGHESTNVGAGNKDMGDAVNVEQATLWMSDEVGAEYETAPTAKKMSVDADGLH